MSRNDSTPSQQALFCQRWRERREYRIPGRGVIRPDRYRVGLVEQAEAKRFVIDHHYSGSFPAARLSVGLFCASSVRRLLGVAVFAVPMNQHVVPKHLGLQASEGVELSRLVLLDAVPGNGESWFVSRAFRLLAAEKPEIAGVVSYCDPLPRATADGKTVMPGHVGTVYQALNARYCGRSKARPLLFGPDGTVISERALSKIRSGDQGADYAGEQLARMGAPRRRPGESGASWIERAQASGRLRRRWHPGNHVYAFGVGRSVRRRLEPNFWAYPKEIEAA